MEDLFALLEHQVAVKDAQIALLQDQQAADSRTITALALEVTGLQVLLQEKDAEIVRLRDRLDVMPRP